MPDSSTLTYPLEKSINGIYSKLPLWNHWNHKVYQIITCGELQLMITKRLRNLDNWIMVKIGSRQHYLLKSWQNPISGTISNSMHSSWVMHYQAPYLVYIVWPPPLTTPLVLTTTAGNKPRYLKLLRSLPCQYRGHPRHRRRGYGYYCYLTCFEPLNSALQFPHYRVCDSHSYLKFTCSH